MLEHDASARLELVRLHLLSAFERMDDVQAVFHPWAVEDFWKIAELLEVETSRVPTEARALSLSAKCAVDNREDIVLPRSLVVSLGAIIAEYHPETTSTSVVLTEVLEELGKFLAVHFKQEEANDESP